VKQQEEKQESCMARVSKSGVAAGFCREGEAAGRRTGKLHCQSKQEWRSSREGEAVGRRAAG
jgi:hypothetical protein